MTQTSERPSIIEMATLLVSGSVRVLQKATTEELQKLIVYLEEWVSDAQGNMAAAVRERNPVDGQYWTLALERQQMALEKAKRELRHRVHVGSLVHP